MRGKRRPSDVGPEGHRKRGVYGGVRSECVKHFLFGHAGFHKFSRSMIG